MRVTRHGAGIHAHQVEQAKRPLQGGSAAQPVIDRAFNQGLSHGAARVERTVRVLKHNLHAFAQRPQLGGRHHRDVLRRRRTAFTRAFTNAGPTQQHRAATGIDQTNNAARHRALARARFAHDAQGLAAADFEVDVLRRMHAAVRAKPAFVKVGFLQSPHLQNQRRGGIDRSLLQLQSGHGCNQHAGIGVLGPLQHIVLAADLYQVAQAQHGHTVRHFGHHAEIMGDEEHARAVALLQIKHQLQNLRLGGDIQRGGGLVRNQQHWVQHQRHGNHDALALAA